MHAFSRLALTLPIVATLVACGGGGGNAGTPIGTITVVIGSHPANQAVVSGQTARFAVSATGAGSLSYQWRLNGSDVAGATAASYAPAFLTTAQDNAQVSVRVTDANGAVLSQVATLRVYSPANVPAPAMNAFLANSNDSAIDPGFGQHVVGTNAAISAQDKLFVWLPASGTVPAATQLLLQAAANNGLHALGLAYPNDVVIGTACLGSGDAECWAHAREEIRTGSGVSGVVSVNAANAIEQRLVKALQYLQTTQPERGWSQYLDTGGAVRWDKVRVGGHSQGGGHAAYLANKRSLDRACLLSSPADFDEGRQQPATWLASASATPAARIWGFTHLRDSVVPWAKLQLNWNALGLAAFGAATSVDDTATSAYAARHMLTSNRDAIGLPTSAYHGVVVTDSLTPLDNGVPVFGPAWQAACFL